MELFTLLKREIHEPPYRLLRFSIIAGISNAFLIGIINSAAENVANKTMNWKYFILYLLSMLIFSYSKRYILDQCSGIVEMVVAKIRYRLAEKIRHAEFATFEKYGTSVMYARLSQDATVIASVATTVISGLQQALMIVFTLLYISTVSLLACALIGVGLALGIFYYLAHSEAFEFMWRAVSVKETEFLDKLEQILKGFKEININRRKNENVFNDYAKINHTIRVQRTITSQRYNTTLIFAQVFFYLLLCIILFGMPKIHTEYTDVTIKIVAAVLFITGPLESLLYSIPLYAKANASAQNIMELEEMLEKELKNTEGVRIDPNSDAAYQLLPFEKSIEIKGLAFQYDNKGGGGFSVGPIDLTIQKGEVIFVTGGNGSGKSTFLKMFTGLYQPSSGSIELDKKDNEAGTIVNTHNQQQYKNLFATIFGDYHLFDKLYGSDTEPDPSVVKALLQQMELHEAITAYENGGFTSIRLSSGQKKRLALIAAILEDKPIYIFDEVAADLDPEFRDKFYYDILSELKIRNKTLLVVSHDQQYWAVADRILNFRDGVMHELTKEEVSSLRTIELRNDKKI